MTLLYNLRHLYGISVLSYTISYKILVFIIWFLTHSNFTNLYYPTKDTKHESSPKIVHYCITDVAIVGLNRIWNIESNTFKLIDITQLTQYNSNICQFFRVFHKALFLDVCYFLFTLMIWTLLLNIARFIILLMIRISYMLMAQSKN